MFRQIGLLVAAAALLAVTPARAAAPALDDYGKLPAMELVTLSPSGDRYAFVAGDGAARQISIMTADNQLIGFLNVAGVKTRSIEWAGEDYLVVTVSNTASVGGERSVGKAELRSAIIVNLLSHKQTRVFAGRLDLEPPIFGDFGTAQINGRWYGFFGGETRELRGLSSRDWHYANTYSDGDVTYICTDLYRVDLETGALELVAKGDANYEDWVVEPNGEIAAHSLYNEKSGAWRVLTGASHGHELASGRSKLGDFEMLGLGRNGDSVLVRSIPDGGSTQVTDLPLSGGAGVTIEDGESIESPLLDRISGRWVGVTKDGDQPGYALFAPALDAKLQATIKALPGYSVHLISWNADFSRMVVFTDAGDDSGTYWMIDVPKRKALPIGAAYPTVTQADVGPVRVVDWQAADGLALHGVLTLPPGRPAKALPLVVMPHGGPEARDRLGFDYWAQAFASQGYAVFQPNFRGSDGYGAALRNAGFGQWGRKMQTDISDGVAELARQGVVDPKRACIVGSSYGGYAALAGVTIQNGLYRCAVSAAGPADMPLMMRYVVDRAGMNSASVRYWNAYLGAAQGSPILDAISPARAAGRADAPILLIHGKDDTVVPIDQSDAMQRALNAAGKPVERITLADGDHWLSTEDARIATIKASVAFVEKFDPPDPSPAASPVH